MALAIRKEHNIGNSNLWRRLYLNNMNLARCLILYKQEVGEEYAVRFSLPNTPSVYNQNIVLKSACTFIKISFAVDGLLFYRAFSSTNQ